MRPGRTHPCKVFEEIWLRAGEDKVREFLTGTDRDRGSQGENVDYGILGSHGASVGVLRDVLTCIVRASGARGTVVAVTACRGVKGFANGGVTGDVAVGQGGVLRGGVTVDPGEDAAEVEEEVGGAGRCAEGDREDVLRGGVVLVDWGYERELGLVRR